MERSCLSLLYMILLALAMTACTDYAEPEDWTFQEYSIPENSVFSVEKDTVKEEFHLLNSRGDTTTTFRRGEDIIFDIVITNLGKDVKWYGGFRDLLGRDIFRVFSEDGVNYGVACDYDYESMNLLVEKGLVGGHYEQWRCSWLGRTEVRSPFTSNAGKNKPLPRGRYYTIAPIMFYKWDERAFGMKCVIHFTVE